MPKVEWPQREVFLSYLDVLKKRYGVRYDVALAEAAGLSAETVTAWRSGERRPEPADLVLLAQACDVNFYDLAALAGIVDGAAGKLSGLHELDRQQADVQSVASDSGSDTWDHEAFRRYVLTAATNAGLGVRPVEVARATGLDQSQLSRWFRGITQPSIDNLQKLTAAIPEAKLGALLVLAGHVSGKELGLPAAPRLAHLLAQDVDVLLSVDSPLPGAERALLEMLLERVLAPYQDVLSRERSADR